MAAAGLSQRLSEAAPYSYRADPAVPAFPDDKAIIVFDGVCVLCTGSARFVIERDGARAFRFATTQSPLGQALFRHYGLDTEAFETNLVLIDGRAYGKLDSVAAVCWRLGGGWVLVATGRCVRGAISAAGSWRGTAAPVPSAGWRRRLPCRRPRRCGRGP